MLRAKPCQAKNDDKNIILFSKKKKFIDRPDGLVFCQNEKKWQKKSVCHPAISMQPWSVSGAAD